jgi:hypothetical protein
MKKRKGIIYDEQEIYDISQKGRMTEDTYEEKGYITKATYD